MQIYFIDNEDYFQRKAVFTDKNNKFFEDESTEKSNLMNYDNNYQSFYNNPDFVIYDDVHNYNGRNGSLYRFHKLDIGINFTKKLKRGTRVWNISIYNVYNRQNPFMLYFKTIDGNIKLVQMSLFPIIPSFSYS